MRSPLSLLNRAPIPYAGRGALLPGIPGLVRSDRTQQMAAMGAVGTLFAIVNRTSNATAQVDWHLYRKSKTGKKEDREEVTRHLALDLWNRANPFYPRQEFVETFQQHLDLTGEGWWVIAYDQRAPTIPLEMWPVRPDRMAPVPHGDKCTASCPPKCSQFLAGYVYTSPDGEQIPLGLHEVVQLKMPNPLDPYRGMGPVQALLADLEASRYASEWNRNFFLNSAEPGGIIEVPDSLSEGEFNELSMRWNEQHKGVARAHRVAIIERGKWVDRKFSMRDMQFVELRRVNRDALLEGFGMHRASLGITEDVNRANAEAGEVMFSRRLTVPRLERIRGALNHDFLPLFGSTGQGLEFDYENPVPDDREADNTERTSKASAAKDLVDAGYDPDDVAVAFDLPKMRYVGRAPAPIPAPEPPVAPTNRYPAGVRTGDVHPHAQAHAQAHAHMHGGPRNAPPLGTPPEGVPAEDVETVDGIDLSGVQAAWETALAALVTGWIGTVVAGWIDDLVDAVRAVIRGGDRDALAALKIDSAAAARRLTDAMTSLARKAAAHVVGEAADQDVTIRAVVPDPDDLEATARTVAAMEAARYALSAGNEAVRVAGPGVDDEQVGDYVRLHLEGLSDAAARAALGGALTDAQNTARKLTLLSGPEGALYASEQMDTNTCGPCRMVHGRWIANTSDMATVDRLYPRGGYIDCQGGLRCRGTIVGVWRPDQAEGAA